MTKPSLRTAKIGDLPLILRSEQLYMQTIEPDSLSAWTAALDRNLELWIDNLRTTTVVEIEGLPVGYVMWAMQGQDALLITMNVQPEFRLRGIGAYLLASYVADGSKVGARLLKLGVHRTNAAQRLYEAAGFKSVGVDGDYLLYSMRP